MVIIDGRSNVRNHPCIISCILGPTGWVVFSGAVDMVYDKMIEPYVILAMLFNYILSSVKIPSFYSLYMILDKCLSYHVYYHMILTN